MSVFRGGLAQLGERLICIQEVNGSIPLSSTNIMLRLLNKYEAAQFVSTRHYSAVMPRLTKYYFGYYIKDKLVGVITFGWGTRPKHTIQKLFPSLDTKDYYEIGKMCLDDSLPKNSESQLLSKSIDWLKKNTDIKYLFTWADGIVGKPGYVYQAANFLYGGFSETDLYVTENGEKVHPRTMQGLLPNTDGKKYGHRPNYEQRIDLNLKRVKGKQYKYIYPINKDDREYLSNSTVDWSIQYPKDDNLEWKVMAPGEKEWTTVSDIPFIYNKDFQEFNSRNVNKIEDKFGNASLDSFLT